ncbi:uncharacterized protein LOC143217528 [Lasioglossum baleicum]|uniref:uncharacterized protein LOC143217528 n=1 Tax=Lasioglossum baleicum TaxID=434251 RepID=UPI003FCC890E
MFKPDNRLCPNARRRLKASSLPKPWENEGQCREKEEFHQDIAELHQIIEEYTVEEEENQIIEGYTVEEEENETIEGYTVEEGENQITERYTVEEEENQIIEGYTVEEEENETIEGYAAEQENGNASGTEDIAIPQEDYSINMPSRVYAKTQLYFSETEDDRMEWVATEPLPSYTSYPARRTKTKKISHATRLEKINRTLRREIADLKLTLKCHEQKLQRAVAAKVRVPKAAETVDEFLDRQKCLNKVSRTMVKLQLKKDNVPYMTEEQDLSKIIFYYSPSAYNKLRKNGCHLPAESTVRRWIAINNLDTGFEDHVFDNIKRRLSELPLDQRLCALKWDETSIRTWEEYSASLDKVEGLVDLGMLG